jgi:hypothetical protein
MKGDGVALDRMARRVASLMVFSAQGPDSHRNPHSLFGRLRRQWLKI